MIFFLSKRGNQNCFFAFKVEQYLCHEYLKKKHLLFISSFTNHFIDHFSFDQWLSERLFSFLGLCVCFYLKLIAHHRSGHLPNALHMTKKLIVLSYVPFVGIFTYGYLNFENVYKEPIWFLITSGFWQGLSCSLILTFHSQIWEWLV